VENPCEYISAKQVARTLNLHPNAVARVVAAANVRILAIPGCYPKYNRADVEALLQPVRAGEQRQSIAS
jgi:hypothetical protein